MRGIIKINCILLAIILLSPIYGQAKRCRNCKVTIDSYIKFKSEKFFADTFLTIDGKKVTINELIRKKRCIINIIRLGDRQEWVKKTLDLTRMIEDSCPNIKIIFVFLDVDSSIAIQIPSQIKFQAKIEKFTLLYINKYTQDPLTSKITRWNLQLTPAVCLVNFSHNKKIGLIYSPLIKSNIYNRVKEFLVVNNWSNNNVEKESHYSGCHPH